MSFTVLNYNVFVGRGFPSPPSFQEYNLEDSRRWKQMQQILKALECDIYCLQEMWSLACATEFRDQLQGYKLLRGSYGRFRHRYFYFFYGVFFSTLISFYHVFSRWWFLFLPLTVLGAAIVAGKSLFTYCCGLTAGTVLYYNTERFHLIEHSEVILFETQGCDPANYFSPRGYQYAVFRDKRSQHTLAVFNIHPGPNLFSPETRADQLDQVWTRASVLHRQGHAILVTGDFNNLPQRTPSFLTHCCGTNPPATWNKHSPFVQTWHLLLWPMEDSEDCIDHQYHCEKLTCENQAVVLKEPDLSDHYGIWASYKWSRLT